MKNTYIVIQLKYHMDDWLFYVIILLLATILYVLVYTFSTFRRLKKYDATVWGGEIDKFEKEDLKDLKSDVIVFIGSSSIRKWKTLHEDMSPLPVLNRGFGGARIPDIMYYFEEVILPYNPKGIVFYAGENDISGFPMVHGETAEVVSGNFKKFCKLTRQMDENIPIYFISIKPPKRRRKHWSEMKKANALINEFCNSSEGIFYIDITEAMMNGEDIKGDLFVWDGIHMNAKGYTTWTEIIKPILIKKFQ